MRHVIATLWAGDDLPGYSANKYGVEDVLRLWRGVRKYVTDGVLHVLCDELHMARLALHTLSSDEPDLRETLRCHYLEGHGIGGWTPIMEAFSERTLAQLLLSDGTIKNKQRHLLVGLDTVFVANSDWLFDWDLAPIGLPADPYHPESVQPCDAVVTFDVRGATLAWSEYKSSKLRVPFPHMYAGYPSEMELLRSLHHFFSWPMLEGHKPKKLVSYKANKVKERGIPEEATIVYFHGYPKPSDLPTTDPVHKFLV